jgi:hypothetical protein
MKMRFWFGAVLSLIALGITVSGAIPAENSEDVNPNGIPTALKMPPTVSANDSPVFSLSSADLLAQQPGVTTLRPPSTTPLAPLPQPLTPPAVPTDENALAQATPLNNLNTTARSPGYSLASTTNMIGDTLGTGFLFLVEPTPGKPSRIAGNVPQGDGTIKVSEDCSPLPVDRVFFDFNHFENALVTANGANISLSRYTVGVEKTFLDVLGSVEFKLPFDSGLSATQSLTATTADNQGTLFGTMAITPKILLYQDDRWATSAGLGVGLPTMPNVGLNAITSKTLVFDDAVHVAPFVGLLLTPNNRWFSITYVQFDFDCNGDRVVFNGNPEGRLRDPTLMYVDCSVGYWLSYNEEGLGVCKYLTGLAPILELHYTTTLEDARGVPPAIMPVSNAINALNMTAGMFFKLGSSAGLTVAAVAPLRTSPSDKQFDAEVLVQFNRWFY